MLIFVPSLWAALYNFISGLAKNWRQRNFKYLGGGRGGGGGGVTNNAYYDFKGINEYVFFSVLMSDP